MDTANQTSFITTPIDATTTKKLDQPELALRSCCLFFMVQLDQVPRPESL